jgi:hypothetical protein
MKALTALHYSSAIQLEYAAFDDDQLRSSCLHSDFSSLNTVAPRI